MEGFLYFGKEVMRCEQELEAPQQEDSPSVVEHKVTSIMDLIKLRHQAKTGYSDSDVDYSQPKEGTGDDSSGDNSGDDSSDSESNGSDHGIEIDEIEDEMRKDLNSWYTFSFPKTFSEDIEARKTVMTEVVDTVQKLAAQDHVLAWRPGAAYKLYLNAALKAAVVSGDGLAYGKVLLSGENEDGSPCLSNEDIAAERLVVQLYLVPRLGDSTNSTTSAFVGGKIHRSDVIAVPLKSLAAWDAKMHSCSRDSYFMEMDKQLLLWLCRIRDAKSMPLLDISKGTTGQLYTFAENHPGTPLDGVSDGVRDALVIDTTVLAGPLEDLKTAGEKGSCFYLVVLHNWLSGTQQNVMAIAELCNENFTAGPLLDGDKKKMAKKTLDQLEKQYLPMGRFNTATEGLFVHQAFVFGKFCSFKHMTSEQLAALKSKYSAFGLSEMIEAAGEDRSSSELRDEARARDETGTPNPPTTQELLGDEGHHIVDERGDIAGSGDIAGTSGRTSGLQLQKEIWKVFQKVGLLGDSSEGGMSGSFGLASVSKILHTASSILGQREAFELIDIGAGCGIVLALGFCYGAKSVAGIEFKNSGQHMIFKSFARLLESHGICSKCMFVQYGGDISSSSALPCSSHSSYACLSKIVLTFCDGFGEKDRSHIFKLVRNDPLVKVFVCMMGKGSKDAFSKPSSVLNELNRQDDEMHQAFSYVGEVAAYMYGSGSKKYLHFFSR
ncbi:hypothetical protein CEUSTIGMA_g13953.t1 [Chlamydomonas eustigma]|uniref:Uncharacterized protein n=1 Tax=Chlamydomonas eustigma TaxID=1157962 RepID=A0A250XU36_9CHLO|nr:hypothetical protein CEUSTIGMA_g13953.t1 [Chlamydomonas eustigma]|eukprot:GAX86546.1 hypothetical protein CEUSTIGMA_g13953.t1 [Chlamydomonas eustigma]